MRALRTRLLTSALVLSVPLAALSALILSALALPTMGETRSRDIPQPSPAHILPDDVSDDDAGEMAKLGKSYGTWGFDVTGMDTSVKPGDDFYTYANGKALAAVVIPVDESGFGGFDTLADLSKLREKDIITTLAGQSSLSGEGLQIADLYRSAMNSDLRNSLDAKPLQFDFAAIAVIKSKDDMARYMGLTPKGFGAAFFSLSVNDDVKRPGYYALQVGQAGLGLPDRDYYLTDAYVGKKAAYETYITDMLTMAGYADPAKNAHDIVALETAIATVSWTRIERRDDTKMYNPMALKDLDTYAPGFNWNGFFHAADADKATKVIVAENTAFPKIAQIFADTPLDTLKAWEAFRTIDQASAYLSDRFYNRRFEFRSKTLYGADRQRPLWKRAMAVVDSNMGDAVGKVYAARYFPPESKTKMENLVANLLAAMKMRIENVTWMSASTKAKALEKLAHVGVRIGYPDQWRDYSSLDIKADDLYGNIERASTYEWKWRIAHIEEPLDPNDWGLSPQTVNAYYSPTRNEIVFPAAILQPPFFDPNADMAVNYGGIGAAIGHEIVDGFDNQGRYYDSVCTLTDWWTPEDSEKFVAQTKALGAQYNAYQPVAGVHVKGDQTMGENIADLGGILLAMDAYHLSLNGQPGPVIDGFTPEQRVFLGFAQVWQGKHTPDFMKFQVATDVHSPDHFRVVGPIRNVDDWYKAFNVQPGDKYYVKPEDRVRIW